jgi:hypothetical protein
MSMWGSFSGLMWIPYEVERMTIPAMLRGSVDCGTPGKIVGGLTASDAAHTSRESPPGAGGARGQH